MQLITIFGYIYISTSLSMADVHSAATRSYNMSQIRGKNTKPEMLVRKFLHKNGFRYRLHDTKLPGKPDIVLPKYKTIIFIHGCFWHGHEGCKYFVIPKTRTEWWAQKIEKTKMLDEKNKILLENLGWNVIEVFECELKSAKLANTFGELIPKIFEKLN